MRYHTFEKNVETKLLRCNKNIVKNMKRAMQQMLLLPLGLGMKRFITF
jgi:hypothetical protein